MAYKNPGLPGSLNSFITDFYSGVSSYTGEELEAIKEINKEFEKYSAGKLAPELSAGKASQGSAQPGVIYQAAPPVVATAAEPAKEELPSVDELLAELDALVGLENIKKDVHDLTNFIKVVQLRKERGMKVPTVSYHLVFTGNPGTGKTTVARLIAKLYAALGILPKGQLVEVDRSALVAGYMGQTAIKTQEQIEKAMGGVLFIDEAYALTSDDKDTFGREAVETVLKAMEDHRDELVVIVAGYTDLMHKFIDSNPGLSSRFAKYFEFRDYSGEELTKIFEGFCKKNGYVLADDARQELEKRFAQLYETRDENFGNARDARNIFEKVISLQANRLAAVENPSDSELETITLADLEDDYEKVSEEKGNE